MRRFIAFVIAVSTILPTVPLVQAADPPFPDMARSWFAYQDSVQELHDKNVISGYDDGNFRPGTPVNRAEFLKIVFAARGGPTPVEGDCFSDVKEGSWYAPFVCAAARRGIVNGYPDGSFHPEQPVNVAEAMKIVLKAYGQETGEEKPGERWYEPYTDFLDRTDVLRRSSVLPWEELTRERSADMIVRMLAYTDTKKGQNLSSGCGKNQSPVSTTLTVNGLDRTYLLTNPGDSNDTPHPLIVAFHGRTNSNERVRSYYGLDRAARGYVIAYPAALGAGSFNWGSGSDPGGQVRDVAFFDAIVEHLSEHLCIDMNRIYVVGHSLGAWMANSVACQRGGVVRASATVGGDSVLTGCTGPAAALLIHHQRDNLASFTGGERTRDLRLKENACGAATEIVDPHNLQCRKYVSCDTGNPVVWCPHELDIDGQGNHYPHQWPNGTAQVMVRFFEGLESGGVRVADTE